MKISKAIILPIAVLGLVAGIALPVLAASETTAPTANELSGKNGEAGQGRLFPNLITGEVVSIGEDSFVIQSPEEEITILVDDDTRYFTTPVPQQLQALSRNRLELKQRLQNSEQWQIRPQEKRKAEGSASTKLRPNSATAVEKGKSAKAGATGRGPVDTAPGQEKKLRQQWQDQQELKQQNSEQLQNRLEWLRRFGKAATFADISVGATVSVNIAPDSDEYLAKWVLIMETGQ